MYAQQNAVKGSVKDSVTALPLEDASIALYKSNDSSMLSGTVSRKSGGFAFNKIKAGNYFLVVKFVGYESKVVNNVDMHEGQIIDLGSISVQPTKGFLQRVTVRTQQNELYYKIDKQVYKAEQFETVKGGTAIDVLKDIPSVAVNVDGTITLRGSTGFAVLIDGKPIQADIETVLNQIPANAIERIELITTPSAKYDADGKAGIINIITKKSFGAGLSLTANVQGGLPAIHDYNNKHKPVRFGTDATLTYKKKKWEIAAGFSYLRNDAAGYREGNANTTIDSVFTSFPSAGERSFKRHNYSARASVIFNADKHNVFFSRRVLWQTLPGTYCRSFV
jgi:hypothetical protein